jgi:anti-sigma factor RsiW
LFADDEACAETREEVEQHVLNCSGCADYLQWRMGLRDQMKRSGAACRLSSDARRRISVELSRTIQSDSQSSATLVRQVALPLAALFLTGTTGLLWFTLQPPAASPGPPPESFGEVAGASAIRTPIVTEAVRWHRRQVPVEVNGPDAQQVSNWFVSKVEFPVRPPRLRNDVTLLGGRIGSIASNDAAFLVYEIEGTKLSVFVFDSRRSGLEAIGGTDGQLYMDNTSGYNVAIGHHEGIGYAFASELPSELFVELVSDAIER